MAAPPFRVKAIYAYSSEHSDDLNFPQDTIITVTELEDDDWYVGEYISAEGETKSGLFPKNFVEHYEPAPPPRPTRAARPKPAESPAVQTPASPTVSKPKTEEADSSRQNIDALASSTPAEEPVPVIPAPKPAPAPAPSEAPAQPPAAPKLEAAQPAKKPPPPIAEKSSSFKDRLAAFNKQGAAPIAPFKPGGSAPSTFIRKPFVAPPPSRNSYVPPVNREPAPQKIYRREEDPEIAQRKAEDEEAAEKAGLTAHAQPEAAEGNEDAPKPVSLKERIALLQKQQQEAAARRAGETVQKKKPERPVKKRVESHDGQEASRASIDQPEGERATRDSSDIPREAPVRKASKPPAIPREREVSDGNEADQSAAGETTEDNEHDSSTEEEPEPMRHPKALTAEPDAVEEEDETEEGEEEEIDEEERRQLALRERMAKLSGGMGMGAMFGGPPGGMAMPGMGGAPAPRKKPTLQRKHTEEAEEPPTRAPMVPIPGMGLPGLTRSMSSESGVTVGKEDEGHPIKSERAADEVPDIEEVKHASQTERHAPPPPPHGTHLILPPDRLVYCERAPSQSRKHVKSRTITFWDEPQCHQENVPDFSGHGLVNELEKHYVKDSRPLEERSRGNIQRYRLSSGEDYSERVVCRKPLGPYSSPQLRFTRSLQSTASCSYLSERCALSWILGSPQIAYLYYLVMCLC
jgi:hypothetical protein